MARQGTKLSNMERKHTMAKVFKRFLDKKEKEYEAAANNQQ